MRRLDLKQCFFAYLANMTNSGFFTYLENYAMIVCSRCNMMMNHVRFLTKTKFTRKMSDWLLCSLLKLKLTFMTLQYPYSSSTFSTLIWSLLRLHISSEMAGMEYCIDLVITHWNYHWNVISNWEHKNPGNLVESVCMNAPKKDLHGK